MVGSGRRKYLPSTRTGVGSGKTLQYLHTQNNDMNKNTKKTQDKWSDKHTDEGGRRQCLLTEHKETRK